MKNNDMESYVRRFFRPVKPAAAAWCPVCGADLWSGGPDGLVLDRGTVIGCLRCIRLRWAAEEGERCPVCGARLWGDDKLYESDEGTLGCGKCLEVRRAADVDLG